MIFSYDILFPPGPIIYDFTHLQRALGMLIIISMSFFKSWGARGDDAQLANF